MAEPSKMADRRTIYTHGSGYGVLSWRDRSAILIELKNGVVCSWSGVRSVTGVGSGKYGKHLPKTGNKQASRFLPTVHPTNLELTVFEKGIGHFSTPSRIFMYGRFGVNIGATVDKSFKTTPTQILKVQFDRVARPKRGPENNKTSQGYFVKCHGFPISERELQADFPAGANIVAAMTLKP
jgi:hypothetical protein